MLAQLEGTAGRLNAYKEAPNTDGIFPRDMVAGAVSVPSRCSPGHYFALDYFALGGHCFLTISLDRIPPMTTLKATMMTGLDSSMPGGKRSRPVGMSKMVDKAHQPINQLLRA